jgi:hypothetical protein
MNFIKPQKGWWINQGWVIHPLHATQISYIVPVNTYIYNLAVKESFYTGKRSEHNPIVFYFPFKETYGGIINFTNILHLPEHKK